MSESTQTSKTFRKGQKVWFLWMDNAGVYEVNQGKVSEQKGADVYVKQQLEYEGKTETIVTDMDTGKVFTSEKEALMWAAGKCRTVANKWLARADELSARIAKAK